MTLRALDANQVAIARLNAIGLQCSVADAAAHLARWQARTQTLLVPRSLPLPPVKSIEKGETSYAARIRQARGDVAKALGLEGVAAQKISFQVVGQEVWFLGPRPKLDIHSMLAAVQAQPARFIELMLRKALIESAAWQHDTFVCGGFGPGVYLGSSSQAVGKFLHVVEAVFQVREKHDLLLCDVHAKRFMRKGRAQAAEAAATRLASVNALSGHQATSDGMVAVTRVVPEDWVALDARKNPLQGMSLHVQRVRESRWYFLNVVTEFALAFLRRAQVPLQPETFAATHCVNSAFIGLAPLAQLQQPVVVVGAAQPLTPAALAPLQQLAEYLPPYQTAGQRKVQFAPLQVCAAEHVPQRWDAGAHYLYVNGEPDADTGSSAWLQKPGSDAPQPVLPEVAYRALAQGAAVQADAYTTAKFTQLLAQSRYSVSLQGLNASVQQLAQLQPVAVATAAMQKQQRPLQEAIKRCLVELSLQEVLQGRKNVELPEGWGMTPMQLTLLATRTQRLAGERHSTTQCAAVELQVAQGALQVRGTRRTPWGSSAALLAWLEEFKFLERNAAGVVRDRQFWVIDTATQTRLRVHAGSFVPRIILNAQYESIEAAMAAQDAYLERAKAQGRKGQLLSKSAQFNVLPYYISVWKAGCTPPRKHGERTGTKVFLQDRGDWLRVFVPPESGINGAGDSFSGMRDVMLYGPEGESVTSGLLESPLVQLYLHTLTNGVLVGGENSKMSLLEKLVRLALQN